MDKNFPYTSVFESNVSYGGLFAECPFYSQASLEGLRPLIPNWEANTSENIDLLAFAANACAAGLANKNDDMIEPEAAIESLPLWRQKMLNSEHDRSKIIGHLITSGLSSENDSVIISAQDALASRRPFNISVGGVVYRLADRGLASKLEGSSDPESPSYKSLSLSMEYGMPDFDLAIGSNNFYDAEIISNQIHVNELKKYLKIYGGNGETKDKQRVYRLIKKNGLPLGCGLVSRPAGIMPLGTITNSNQQISKNTTISLSTENNLDQNKKPSVTTYNQPQNMEKFELFMEEVKATLLANKIKEETAASMTKDFAEQIKVASTEYVAQVGEAKAAREKAEKETAEIKVSLAAQAKELADTKASLEKIQAQANEKAAAELFSARMDEFNNEYDLDDEDRAALAGEIKNLDASAEAFAAFKKKMGTFMKDKSKTGKEAKDKEAKASLDKAVAEKLATLAKASSKTKLTDEELATKIFEQVQANITKASVIPNNTQSLSDEPSLKDKWSKLFEDKDAVKVTL